MAGITDLPFRQVVLGFGADLVVSEMVTSTELLTNRASAHARAELGLENRHTSVQIAGREAAPMVETARILAGQGARIIDINMGCPAKKVTSGYSGAALLRDPDLALRLIDAVVSAVDVPVTLKMRLGWDRISAPALARSAQSAGVQMITVHGRTRQQFYKGQADWAAVAQVTGAVDIPVVVNGDITGPDSARRALEQSNAAAVMVGRGAEGAPWRLAQIRAALAGKPVQAAPEGAALADLIIGHYESMLSFYGTHLGLRVARKHLSWYLQPLENGAEIRSAIIRQTDPARVIAVLRSGLGNHQVAA